MTKIEETNNRDRFEQLFRSMFDQSPQSIQIFAPDGRTLLVNRAWESLWGLTLEQLANYNILQDQQLVAKGIMPYVERGFAGEATAIPDIHYDVHETLPEIDKHRNLRRWVHAFIYPIKDTQGSVSQVVLMHEDITESKRVEETLRESEELFRSLFENSRDAIVITDDAGNYLQVNQSACELLNYTREQLLQMNVSDLQTTRPPDAGTGYKTYLQTGVQTGEFSFMRPDGESRVAQYTASHFAPGRHLSILRDITRRKQIEEQLQQQRKEYQAILDSVPALVWYKDKNNRHVRCNKRVVEFLGLPKEKIEGASASDLFPPEQAEQFYAEDLNVINTGRPQLGLVEQLKMPSGELRWHETDKFPSYNQEGEITGVVIFSLDITERRRAEEDKAKLTAQIEKERQRLSSIVASIPGVVWEAWGEPDASSQRIDFVSDYVETMLGYTVEEWLQTPNFWLTIVHPDDRERAARAAAEQFASGRSGQNQFRWVAKDGRVLWVEGLSSVIKDDAGSHKGMRGVTMDVTVRKQAEEEREMLLAREHQLRSEAEKANRLKDEFLATLSHELRTPLTAILGWSKLLTTSELDQSSQAQALEAIVRNAKSQAQLIDDLLDVSRVVTGKLGLDLRPIDLAPVIEAAVFSARPAAGAKEINLHTTFNPRPAMVLGDSNRLQQVIWNLLSNAIKFTPKGGSVEVRLENVGSHVEITVIDTGRGIEPEFLPHVFDRFRQADGSTTRAYGGLGLGLAIVRHLVELQGGTVEAQSEGQQKGATFRVRLPVLAVCGGEVREDKGERKKEANAANVEVTNHHFPLAGLRVLAVDDDADAREIIMAMLKRWGVEVKVAGTAGEALKTLESWKPDVLISDIGMPGEDGYTLIRQVRSLAMDRGGETPAVALTAYASSEDRLRVLSAGYQVHVTKPVEPVELMVVIAGLAGRTISREVL